MLFCRKSKAVLKEGGYFALILPVSILQKGGIYEKTRELLLAHFKLLCLVELNSRTFGSTGTQTIILFAQRVKKYDEDLIARLKDSNFSDKALNDDFNDKTFMQDYCEFMGYDYEGFGNFMGETDLNKNLKNSNVFKEYLADYESSKPKVFKKKKLNESDKKALFEHSSLFCKDLDSKTYKKQYGEFLTSNEYKEAEANLYFQNFLNQIKDLECEKMLYFSYIKDEKVLILKSPSDKNKESKSNKANIVKFLGYDWSKRKGDEGIKYITNKPLDEELEENKEDSDEENKQKEALRNINSVKFIQTPLYNPSNKEDSTKLAYALKSFMEGDSNNALSFDKLLESLQSGEQDSYTLFSVQCKDLLDFSRVEFSKTISLNPKIQRKIILSKYPIVKLETCGEFFMGGTPSRKNPSYWNGDIKWLTIGDYTNHQIITDTKEKITQEGVVNSNVKIIQKGAVVISIYATIGRVGILGEDMATNQAIVSIAPNQDFINKYLMYVIDFYKFQLFDEAITTSQKNINLNILQNMLIPKPDIEIQKQIVNECEKVEEQSNTIKASIESYQRLIKLILIKCGINEVDSQNIDEAISLILKELENLESKLDFELLQSLNEETTNKESLALELKEVQNLLQSLPIPPPQGWERKKLDNVAFYPQDRIDTNLLTPQNYVGVDNLLQNKQGKIDAEFILENGTTNAYKNCDILIGNIRPYLKKIWFADIDGGTNNDVVVVRSKDVKVINPKFLYYILSDDNFFQYEMDNAKRRQNRYFKLSNPPPTFRISKANRGSHRKDRI